MKAKPTCSIALLLVGVVAGFSLAGAVQDPRPAPARSVLAKAQAQAAREKKAVFVAFDASW